MSSTPRIELKRIELKIYGGIATVNTYLLKTNTGFVLIDTGPSSKRSLLEKEIKDAGCNPGNLKLIILTHGDADHTGNASFLRQEYGGKIALHPDDSIMVQKGDMSHNRKVNPLIKVLFALPFVKLKGKDQFNEDIELKDGFDLSPYDLNAKIIHIPGHSQGSVGVLTAGGYLFCGDLLENTAKPAINSIMDDEDAAQSSIEKLKKYTINMVYPGHGKPFPLKDFLPLISENKDNKRIK